LGDFTSFVDWFAMFLQLSKTTLKNHLVKGPSRELSDGGIENLHQSARILSTRLITHASILILILFRLAVKLLAIKVTVISFEGRRDFICIERRVSDRHIRKAICQPPRPGQTINRGLIP
jgi:hypothetical protein